MTKKIILILFFLLFIIKSDIVLAKTLPQARGAGAAAKQTTVKPAVGKSVAVSARLRRDRHALTVFFGNLSAASNVSYTLTYTTQGRQEGAGGSVRQDEGNSASRELLFGTCSKNVCTYHANITNMKLEVTGQLKNGKTFTKRFKIKV